MARVQKAFTPLSLLLAVFTLVGCPPQPKLSVSPLAIAISAQEDASRFQISNAGGGTLNWTATESLPWLQLQASAANDLKQGGSVQGSLSTGVNGVELIVDRSVLGPGTTTGEVQVTSNGGTQTVRVSVSEAESANLEVNTTEIDFGATTQTLPFVLRNTGTERLTWSAAASEESPWLELSPSGGALNANEQIEVQATVTRGTLAANNYDGTITITSSGGNRTITARMTVATFEVTPASLNFGALLTASTRNLSLRNRTFSNLPVDVAVSTTDGGAWLTAALPTVNLGSQATASLGITSNPAGLTPGDYTGTVTLTNGPFSATIPVTMSVGTFSVSNSLFDLGEISVSQTRSVTLTSVTGTAIDWTTAIPASDRAWLSVDPSRGTVTTTQSVTIVVNPLTVDPGDYESTVTFNFPGGGIPVTVRFSRPEPASLKVAPSQVQLGTTKSEELIAIWNPGVGSVNWQIDTNSFPAWLTLVPVNGSGVASGTVSGDITQTVTVRVDRSLAPANQFNLAHTFDVVGSGAVSTTVPVTVSATVPQVPVIVVETEGIGANNVNFINLDINQTTETLILRNEGNGNLAWNIDPTTLPEWIASIQPAQGNLAPGTQITVTVTVDRSSLTYLGAQTTVNIASNDPERNPFPFVVEVVVDKRVAITGRPNALAFGPTQTSDVVEIANNGDPDTLLNFQITTTKEWLSVFPESGSSIGTASPTKDFRPFSVTIDRSLLEGNGASAKIVVTAFTTENGVRIPLPDVEPFEIDVTAQAAELTIQSPPVPYLRPPSIVRFPLMLRNVRYQIMPLDVSLLPQVAQQFTILENDVPLELSETNQLMRSLSPVAGSGSDLGAIQTVLIMLDYSGSMQESAASVSDPDVANAIDPIQALYEKTLPPLFDTFGANTRVGLAIFSERGGNTPLRLLLGTGAEPVEQQDDIFISDHAALLDRLQNVVVNDNGATQLFGAILGGVEALLLDGYDTNRSNVETTDFPAILCFTDGRITTPPSPINDVIQTLQGTRVRFYPVGWGSAVAADPLVRLAVTSGGHYYSTRAQPTGEVDAFGTPIRIPVVNELADITTQDADECDQSITRDFNSQVMLSYITLNEQSNAIIQGKLNFDDPNDQNSACLPEQGQINGTLTTLPIAPVDIAADNRLGQVSFRSAGVQPDGTAQVTVRLAFTPRNVQRLSFEFITEGANPLLRTSVVQVNSPNGGVISDWTPSGAGNVFTYTSPGDVLPYGQYGDILTINIAGVDPAGGLLRMRVLDPVRTGNPESKYFILPDTLPLAYGKPSYGPALPTAAVEFTPTPALANPRSISEAFVLNFGTTDSDISIAVRNIGGAYLNAPVATRVNWTLSRVGEFPNLVDLDPPGSSESGSLESTEERDTLNLIVNRVTEPGTYSAAFEVSYNGGATPVSDILPRTTVNWTVLPPELTLSTSTLDFGAAATNLGITIDNTGQSTLAWSLNLADFPDWLGVDNAAGSVPFGADPSAVNFTVDRTGLAPGTYSFDVEITDAYDESTPPYVPTILTITMDVP